MIALTPIPLSPRPLTSPLSGGGLLLLCCVCSRALPSPFQLVANLLSSPFFFPCLVRCVLLLPRRLLPSLCSAEVSCPCGHKRGSIGRDDFDDDALGLRDDDEEGEEEEEEGHEVVRRPFKRIDFGASDDDEEAEGVEEDDAASTFTSGGRSRRPRAAVADDDGGDGSEDTFLNLLTHFATSTSLLLH